jgi:hypothetical protein
MIGPAVLFAIGAIAGFLGGGWPGASVGVALAGSIVVAVVVLAAIWGSSFGFRFEPETAWEIAPRPPGFGRVCDFVYERVLPKRD